MRSSFPTLVLTSLIWLAAGALAHADTAVVAVAGKATTKDRATAASAVRSAAQSGGWQLADTSLAEGEIAAVLGCLKTPQYRPCVAQLLTRRKIERLIVVSLDPDPGESGALTLTENILLPGVDVISSDQRTCAKCSDERLTRLAFDLTKQLLQEASAGAGRTKLRIVTTPSGAWITLDATNVGTSDRTLTTFPGVHTILVSSDGYQPESRTVEVVENRETLVEISLHPAGDPRPGQATTTSRSRALEITLVGVGAASVLGGAIALGLNQPDDATPPGERQPRYRYDTVPAGITAIAGGVVVGSIGAYLWWKHARDDAKAPRPAPSVTPVAGGAVLGVHGEF